MMHRVLVLGGYGNFGTIIARKLAGETGIAVVVAGRNASRAAAFARDLGTQSAHLDADAPDLAAKVSKLRIDTLISTAGPFQGKDYSVPRAAIAARAHYIDLADARHFVCGIAALDGEAKARGVLVASGASSVPALAAAVVDSFLPEFSVLEDLKHGICSSEKTPGVATVAAVLGYCGRPFEVLEGGQWKSVYGWQELERRTLAHVGPRWFANCDVPDLEVFARRYPSLRTLRRRGRAARWNSWGTVEAPCTCKCPEWGMTDCVIDGFGKLPRAPTADLISHAWLRSRWRRSWRQEVSGRGAPCLASDWSASKSTWRSLTTSICV